MEGNIWAGIHERDRAGDARTHALTDARTHTHKQRKRDRQIDSPDDRDIGETDRHILTEEEKEREKDRLSRYVC